MKGATHMAITIDDIYDKEFALKGGGYDRDDVDQFLDEICDEMTSMQEKIASLESDLQKAQDELKTAREAVKPAPVVQAQPAAEETPIAKTSSTLESILLSAQRLADEEVDKAKEKAAQIIKDAEDQASRLVDDAQEEKEALTKNMETLRTAAADYRKSFQELLKKYQDMLDSDQQG